MTADAPIWLEQLRDQVGQEVGVTDWFTVTQRDADLFSALTDDWDYMHNDPDWAQSRFGGTIAHGLYVLSLVPRFLKEVAPSLPIVATADASVLNYGFDTVRFISPLRIGEQARDRVELLSLSEKRPGDYLARYRHTIEGQLGGRPFLVAESLSYYVTDYEGKWGASDGEGEFDEVRRS
jgi:acyl dehydratase